MKKSILFLLCFLVLLVGCNNKEEQEKEYSLNVLSSTTKIEVMKEWNNEGYLDNKVITNLNDLKEFINELNSLKLQKEELDNYDFKEAIYYIQCGEKHIYITNKNTIYVKEESKEKYSYKEGNINFIDSLFTNRIYEFNEFEFSGDIVVKENKTSKEAKVNDTSSFYQSLTKIRFKNISQQDISFDYIISIGNKKIYVKDDMFVMEDNYYQVTEGTFDFLKELKYDSSGWLPWI